MHLKGKLFTLYIFVGIFFVGGFTSLAEHQPINVLLHKNKPFVSNHVDRAVNINIFTNDNSDTIEDISCSDGYYFANNVCYKLTRNLDDHCLTNKDCELIDNAVCSESRCACTEEFFKSGNRCQRLIGASCTKNPDCKINNSKCKWGTCQCDGAYYPANNNTECLRLNDTDRENSVDYISYVRDLHVSCDASLGCEIPFSTCVEGKCYCEPNHVKHGNACYGLPYATCTKPSDCISTSYSCDWTGTCINVDYEENGKLLSSKPGISAYWVNQNLKSDVADGVYAGKDFFAEVRVGRKTINNVTEPGKLIQKDPYTTRYNTIFPHKKHVYDYEMLMSSDVEWTNSTYTLDKVVYGGAATDNKLYLICRVTIFQLTSVGKLEPPLYSSCTVMFFDQIFSFDKFDVLVHK